ncbi:caspase family protein [Iningainema tapete]|uniref:Caspase family protein n=1 Tax=Iningainema tapete BLCC-T55 TaxID=2748662 RepID=A0A8J7BZP8_9CYAN|nr:caspase family protein [Iningainema tapete]MBD2778127.1 caspase family protein [Iningainema tapete BLCC-T55]
MTQQTSKASTREPKRISIDTVPSPVKQGRLVVVVIGINEYEHFDRLSNAVNDARKIQEVLINEFNFITLVQPLFDRDATKDAIDALVEDQLPSVLNNDDSLLLFFAGHGCTQKKVIDECSETIEIGYIVPVDAQYKAWSSYIRLSEWLGCIAELPAKHILVIIDACHSGCALGNAKQRYRHEGKWRYEQDLYKRRSRKIITSALGDQVALDGNGPIYGHSLFTGHLINGLRTREADTDDNSIVTARELGLFVQQQVAQATKSSQTPDFGSFYLDEGGELVIALPTVNPLTEKILNKDNSYADAQIKNENITVHFDAQNLSKSKAVLILTLIIVSVGSVFGCYYQLYSTSFPDQCYVVYGFPIESIRGVMGITFGSDVIGNIFEAETLEIFGFSTRTQVHSIRFFRNLARFLIFLISAFLSILVVWYILGRGPLNFANDYKCIDSQCLKIYKLSYLWYLPYALINFVGTGVTFVVGIYAEVKDLILLKQVQNKYTNNLSLISNKDSINEQFQDFRSLFSEQLSRYLRVFLSFAKLFGFEWAIGSLPLTSTGKSATLWAYFSFTLAFLFIFRGFFMYEEAIAKTAKTLSKRWRKQEYSQFFCQNNSTINFLIHDIIHRNFYPIITGLVILIISFIFSPLLENFVKLGAFCKLS